MRQHDQRHMVMPSAPTAAFIVIKSEFLFELLIVLLDFPARLGHLYQATKTVSGRQITQEGVGRLRDLFRPLHQQPDLFPWLTAFMKSVRNLHPARPEARLQPTLAAFSPANFLPALSLLSSLFDRDGPLLAVVPRGWRTPGLPWFQLAGSRRFNPNSRVGLHSHDVRQFALLQLFTKSRNISIASIRHVDPVCQFPIPPLVDHLQSRFPFIYQLHLLATPAFTTPLVLLPPTPVPQHSP